MIRQPAPEAIKQGKQRYLLTFKVLTGGSIVMYCSKQGQLTSTYFPYDYKILPEEYKV